MSSSITSGSRDSQRVWLPKQGYMSVWDTGLANSGSALCEASFGGNSTTYGQTASGGAGYNASNYSYVQKIRALMIAAEYTDGGVGIRSYQDNSALNTIDNLDAMANVGTFVQYTGVGYSNGSNVVTSTSVTGLETGRRVVMGAGFASQGYVQVATAGTSLTLVTTQGGAVALNATSGPGSAACNVYSDGWVALNSTVGLGPLSGYDLTTPAATGTGYTCVIQGTEATCRLGYIKYASGGGSFTYKVNNGSATTIACTGSFTGAAFASIANPSPGSTCQITITTTVAGTFELWPEWVNSTGVVAHKDGLSTQKLVAMYPASNGAVRLGYTYNEALVNAGLTNTTGNGPRNLKLAVLEAGINDMNASTTQSLAEANVQTNATAIGIFGALCENAGIPGIVVCPNFWSYGNALLFAPYFKEAHYAATKAAGLAWYDPFGHTGPVSAASTNGWTFGSQPHMNQTGYDALANGLWTDLLNPVTGVR